MRSYMAYTPAVAPQEYITKSGVYISTAVSILLSQGCIFWQLASGWVSVYSSTAKKFATAAQRNGKLVFAMEDHFPPVLTRRATANTIEPPRTVFSTYCTSRAQQPKHLTNFPGYSCSDTVPYLVCWTAHGQTLLLPDTASHYPDEWRR